MRACIYIGVRVTTDFLREVDVYIELLRTSETSVEDVLDDLHCQFSAVDKATRIIDVYINICLVLSLSPSPCCLSGDITLYIYIYIYISDQTNVLMVQYEMYVYLYVYLYLTIRYLLRLHIQIHKNKKVYFPPIIMITIIIL